MSNEGSPNRESEYAENKRCPKALLIAWEAKNLKTASSFSQTQCLQRMYYYMEDLKFNGKWDFPLNSQEYICSQKKYEESYAWQKLQERLFLPNPLGKIRKISQKLSYKNQ